MNGDQFWQFVLLILLFSVEIATFILIVVGVYNWAIVKSAKSLLIALFLAAVYCAAIWQISFII